MDQIIVTHVDGSTIKLQSKENGSQIIKATQNVQLLGNDTVDITVQSALKLNFYVGDKITIIGRDYTLNTPAREQKISEFHFVYDIQFEGLQYDLLRAAYSVNIDTTSNTIQDISGDSLTGDLKRFLDVLISNANRVFPGKWVLGTYPTNTETRTETFSDTDTCLTVLQSLCSEDKYNTEFKINIISGGVRQLNIGATGKTFTYTFQYGKGKGIFDLTREKMSSTNIITRLNVFGGSNNIITSKYRASKLCLPNKTKAQSYLEDSTAIATYGIWEATKNFDDIFPSRVGTVSALGSNELKFIDSSLDFDLNAKDGSGNSLYLIAGTTAKIHFNTGNLAGYEFELTAYDHATKQFTLIPLTDENGYVFPSPTTAAFKIAVGDKYVITDIYLPQSYITAAEAKLQTAGQAYLTKYSKPRVQYSLTIDKFFLKDIAGEDASSNVIWIGDYIPILDTDIAVNATIRVSGFTRDLLDDYPNYQLTISDQTVNVTIITRVISDIKDLDNIVRINNLTDAGRARRNWLASQELLNMVFDTEGDYYSEKIKPLSIETTMLSVGAKSTQFGLIGTIFQPNYAGTKNRVVYTGGTLTHYAIVDSNGDPKVWNLTDGDITLGSDAAYYIYAKCSRTGSGGSIVFSTNKIIVDSDGAFYHFLLGVINSVDSTNARALALTYGFTTINGRFIRTGRIQSPDGATYFDLDAGEFKGNFKFTSGASVETSVINAQTAANNAQSSADSALWNIGNIISDNVLSAAEKPSQRQEWNVITAEKPSINTQAANFGITAENTAYNNAYQALGNYLNAGTWTTGIPNWISDPNLANDTAITGSTYRTTWETFYTARQALLNAISAKAKALADAAQNSANSALTNAASALSAANVAQSAANTAQGAADNANSTANTANGNANNALTAAQAAQATANALNYLKIALEGSTDISGGLLATNVLLMKTITGAITGGISGLNTDNVGMWTGGTYADAIANIAKIILRKDGSGQFAGGKINWDSAGALNVGLFTIYNNLFSSGNISFTSDSLEDLASIPGSTTTVSVPSQVSVSGGTKNASSQTSNFTLSKNSNVKFRVAQSITTGALSDYAICYARIYNTSNSEVWSSNLSKVMSSNTSQSENRDCVANLPAGSYYLKIDISIQNSSTFQTATTQGYGGSGSVVTIEPIASLTKIANNGFYSFWGNSAYLYLRTDFGFQVMFGSYGLRCTTGGLQKTSNGGSSWTSI